MFLAAGSEKIDHRRHLRLDRPFPLGQQRPAEGSELGPDRNPSLDHRGTCLGIIAGPLRLMIEARHLYSLGIGLTDAHLIASVFLNPPMLLWTRDQRLRKVAETLAIHASLP